MAFIAEILDFSCSLGESPSSDAEARFDSCEKSRISTSLGITARERFDALCTIFDLNHVQNAGMGHVVRAVKARARFVPDTW